MPVSALFKRFDRANLRLRVMSALIMAPAALLVAWLGGIVWGLLITGVVTIGLYEWLRLVNQAAPPRLVGAACAMMVAVMLMGTFISPVFGAGLAVIVTLILFVISARRHEAQASLMALGIPYMAGSGLALLALRGTPAVGGALTFFLLLTVWGTDIGAFISGRLIGGPKLAPAISPSKTWAGLIGGMALAAILGYFVAGTLGARLPWVTLILSPVLAGVAQLGDLFESWFKRRSGVKESGDLIPGHGGVLDRIDGLAFAAVFMALFQVIVGGQINWW